ncbi:MAG TPA: hypothetical protein VJ927_09915 [Actinomycetota bacterium]|nr:hypothetical protein [Actinomycetota bacterium]
MSAQPERTSTEEPKQRICARCKGPLSYAELPGFGRVWQCPSCVMALLDDDGKTFIWRKPAGPKLKQTYQEKKKKSRKACPECRKPMWEVVMPDFGSRWQCEECRLTVFATGGVQHWRTKKQA